MRYSLKGLLSLVTMLFVTMVLFCRPVSFLLTDEGFYGSLIDPFRHIPWLIWGTEPVYYDMPVHLKEGADEERFYKVLCGMAGFLIGGTGVTVMYGGLVVGFILGWCITLDSLGIRPPGARDD